ncbi:MAG: EAL domain-containing protein [Rudaea sp.]
MAKQDDVPDILRVATTGGRSDQRYADLVRAMDGIEWEADAQTFQFVFVGEQAERLLGYPCELWLSEAHFWHDHIHPDDRSAAVAVRLECAAKKAPRAFEYRMIARDGHEVWVRDFVSIHEYAGRPAMMRGVMVDITAGRSHAQMVVQVANLYAALCQINHAIVLVKTREELFARICEALVEFGKFKMVWIGWNDPSDATVSVVSQHGDADSYLKSITVRSDDCPEGRGPVGRAIREGRPCVINNFMESPDALPWHVSAARCDFKACAAFPIRIAGQVCAALAVYAAERDFFGFQEIELLVETAADVSFALDHYEGENRREQAELALHQSENRFRLMFERTADALLLLDGKTGQVVDCNQATIDMLRCTDKQELVSLHPAQFSPAYQPDGRPSAESAEELIAAALCNGSHRFEWVHCSAHRDDFPVEVLLTSILMGEQQLLIATLRDITRRKRDEHTQAALHHISEAAQSATTLPDLFQRIHAIIGALLPAKNFFLAMYDPSKDELTFPYFVDEVDLAPGPMKLSDATLSGEVIRTGQPLLVTPEVQQKRTQQGDAVVGAESLDWLGVPLKSRTRTFGALVVQSYSGDVRYTKKDQVLLEFVSSQVAAAIIRKQAEQALRLSESRLEEAQRLAHLGSWTWEISSGTLSWSDELCRIYGVDPGSHVPTFADFLQRVHSEDRACVEGSVAQSLADLKPRHLELRILRPDGEVRTLSDQSEVLVDDQGRAAGLSGACLDITARKLEGLLEQDRSLVLEQVAQNKPLREILLRIATMLETQIPATRSSIMLLKDGRLHTATAPHLPAAYCQALEGLPIGPMAGSCGTACYTGETVITEDVTTDPRWDSYRHLALPHGLRACWSMPIPSNEGGVLGSFAIYCDRPARPSARDLEFMGMATWLAAVAIKHHRLTDQLEHQAQHDALTGLPNRLLFQDRLSQALAYAERKQLQVAVLYMDLDRFKNINDTLGHFSGDALLVHAGDRLHACIRKSDTLARLGGDEFIVVLTELNDPQDAERAATKLIEAIRVPFHVDGRELFVSVSLGISIYPNDGSDGETLMANADSAMYRAKEKGRDNFQWFAPEMNALARERMDLVGLLRHALTRGELSLHYQPQCGADGEIQGFEALMRWRHPTLGLVPPARFIPHAEDSGLIVQMGEWALREACAQIVAWRRDHPALRVAVNVSAIQFKRTDWVDTVRRVLRDTGLDPKALELEITESLLLQSVTETSANLFELRALGVGIAIDDFGTGYSSLSYLHKLPVTTLKIDQSFVREIGAGSTSGQEEAPIIRTIIALAHNFGMSVVAEGVETEAQRELLLRLGCESLQGYLLYRPLTVKQTDVVLKAIADKSRVCVKRARTKAGLPRKSVVLKPKNAETKASSEPAIGRKPKRRDSDKA